MTDWIAISSQSFEVKSTNNPQQPLILLSPAQTATTSSNAAQNIS